MCAGESCEMSVLACPRITEFLGCGTTEAELGADAATGDNMEMM